MQGNLIFIWQQDKLGLVFGKEEIVLAAEEFCSGFQALGETIRHFLKRHGISPSNIKNVIVVADLTALLPRQLAKESVFGYWRVTPAPFDFAPIAPLIEDSAIKIHSFHLPLPEHSEHEAHFQKALLTFSRLPVRNIAINSTFSRIYPVGEEEIIQRAEELLPGRFTYHPSHNYNTPNFLLRENVLLINLILLDPVKSFLSWLKSSFDDCSVSAPLYFLKGDGTLTSSRTVATNPLITWQSHLASFLLGGSRWFNQGDTVVIIENTGEKGIGLGVTENYLPRLAGRFSSFCGVELPGNYPLTVHFKERPNKTKWEETLEFLNPSPGPIPLISFVPSIEVSPVFRYPIAVAPAGPYVQGTGVLSTPYRLEIEKMYFLSPYQQAQAEKQDLWEAALWQLNQEGIQLSEVNHQFEEISLKYLPQNACIFRLTIWGKLQ